MLFAAISRWPLALSYCSQRIYDAALDPEKPVINGPTLSLPPRRRGVVLARLIESGLPLQRLSNHEANERNHCQPRHYQMGQTQADIIGKAT